MSEMIGRTLGHYKVLHALGKGGMGEVYLADDLTLKRQVALKVLPESLRQNPERLARFRREALAAAKLKHPNIAVIHALEDIDGLTFIGMEYVEGQPLASHIPSDGMELDAFFSTFIPLADALSHAHSLGRIHRDLKPGNIMIAEDGTPKILDFGLARIIAPDPVQAAYEQSETETTPEIGPDDSTVTMKPEDHQPLPSLTRGGQLMGTPWYMSPEQAEREETDHRTDIFSFGVVMYEAITDHKPFDGRTLELIIGRILTEEPKPVSQLKPITPHTLWWTVRKCLTKDRDRRMQTALELHEELCGVQDEVQAGTVLVDASTIPYPVAEPPKTVPFWRQPVAIAGMVLALAIGLIAAWLLKPGSELPLRKFHMPVDLWVPGLESVPAGIPYNGPMISPDGTMVAYTREGQLWVHDLTLGEARPLPGTDEAQRPFWSPDSRFVGYFVITAGSDFTLRTIWIQGGTSTPVCKLPSGYPRGATWNTDGEIVFGMAGTGSAMGSLFTVPALGGTPQMFLTPDSTRGETGIIYPHFLPDGETLVYAAITADSVGTIVVRAGDTRTILVRHPGEVLAFPAYSPTGHIVYQRGFPESNGLWAVPFDPGSGTATGDPFLVTDQGRIPGVSEDGTMVYQHRTGEGGMQQLVWVDRNGQVEGTIGQPQMNMQNPVISPDDRRVAVSAVRQGNWDIWVHDIERGTASPLTFDPTADYNPVWSPDGEQIAFSNDRGGNRDIYLISSDGLGEPRVLMATPITENANDWSSNGQYLVGTQRVGVTPNVWMISLAGDQEPASFADVARAPKISPDGRYVAYYSDKSGQYEIYVQPFPSGKARWQVSTSGGAGVRWSGKGDELFYVEPQTQTLMAVPVRTRPRFERGMPQPLFSANQTQASVSGGYDVSSDGQRFVMVQNVEEATQQTTMTIVMNWIKEFEDRK